MKYESIEGWFSSDDVSLYEEMVARAKDSSVFVEIGAFKGRSTIAMCELIELYNKNIRFITIDHFQGSWEHQDDPTIKNLYDIFLKNTTEYSKSFEILPFHSSQASRGFLSRSIDFLYIDGSHDYESVKQDLNIWFPKIKNGGTIAGHDYEWGGVKQAVNEFALQHRFKIQHYGYASWRLV